MQYIQQEKLHAIKETILQRKEKLAENKRLDLATSHNIYTELTTFRLDLFTTYADSLLLEKEAGARGLSDLVRLMGLKQQEKNA